MTQRDPRAPGGARPRTRPACGHRAALHRAARQHHRGPAGAAHGAARRREASSPTARTCSPTCSAAASACASSRPRCATAPGRARRESPSATCSSLGIGGSYLGPRLVVEALARHRRRPRGALRRQRRPRRPRRRARRARPRLHPGRGGLEDLHHAGDDGQRRRRPALDRGRAGRGARSRSTWSPPPPTPPRPRASGFPNATCSPSATGSAGASPCGRAWGSRSPSPWACPPSSASSPARTRWTSNSAPRRRSATSPCSSRSSGVWNRDFLGIPVPRGAALRPAPREPARLPAAAGDGIERQARRRERRAGRLRHLPRHLRRGGHPRASTRSTSGCTRARRTASCDFIVVARPMGSREARARHPARQRAGAVGSAHDGRARPATRTATAPATGRARPSCCLRLEPGRAGRAGRALRAQGVRPGASLWGVNPFDQFGVELGKTIAGRILPALAQPAPALHPATSHLLGVIRKAAQGGRRPAEPSPAIRHADQGLQAHRRVAAHRRRDRRPEGHRRIRQSRLRAARRRRPTTACRAASLASLFRQDDAQAHPAEHRAHRARARPPPRCSMRASPAAAAGCSSRCSPRSTRATSPPASSRCCTTSPAQRETESALNLTTARLLALVEASPNAALIENSAGEVELVNEAFCRLLGLESAPQSLLGLPAVEVVGRSRAVDAKALARAQRKPDASASIPIELRRRPPRHARAPAAARRRGAGRRHVVVAAALRATSPRKPTAAPPRSRSSRRSAPSFRSRSRGSPPSRSARSRWSSTPRSWSTSTRIRASTETALVAIGDLVDFSKVEGGIELHRAEFGLRAAVADLVKRIAHRRRGVRLPPAREGGAGRPRPRSRATSSACSCC